MYIWATTERLPIRFPVHFQISKAVDWADTGVTHNDKDFTYTVDLGEVNGEGDPDIEGSFDYIKYNASGQALDADDNPQEIAEGGVPTATGQISDGGTLALANGEYVVISGLPSNVDFSVTESNEAGYTPSNTVEGVASTDGAVAEGTIASNDTIEVAYTNTYGFTDTVMTQNPIGGSKILTSRDWADNESFTFTLTPVTEGAPLPEEAQNNVATATLTNNGSYVEDEEYEFEFGSITYSRPGTYVYMITESPVYAPGIDYSRASYQVTVVVADNGDGTLATPDVKIEQVRDDDNVQQNPAVDVTDTTGACFTNDFTGDATYTVNLEGTKTYTDYTGGSSLSNTTFGFTLTAVGGKSNASLTENDIAPVDVPMPEVNTATSDVNGNFSFDDISFDISDAGHVYYYTVTENIPADITDENPDIEGIQYQGMTYDSHTGYVSIEVSQDEDGNIIAHVTDDEDDITFANSYRAASVTTEGTSDGLQITKQLDGAAGTEGQFTFTMVAANDDTRSAITNGWVTGISADGNVETSPAITKDGSVNILFDDLTFTHEGTYTFNITETQNASSSAWTYDGHTYTVSFTVSDENGQLVIADSVTTGSPTFTNSYKANMNYDNEAGGILLSKTLNGRDLAARQFDFTVTTQEGDTISDEKLAEATTVLTNPRGGNAPVSWQAINGLTFDQDDVGQTFTFIISETNAGASGYTYDEQPVTVAITVSDNGDGTLSTVTTVTKDGSETIYNSSDFVSTDPATRPTAPFVNSYTASATDAVSVNFEKQLTGRDWKDSDSFEFTLAADLENSEGVTAEDLAKAMPDETTATVSGANEEKTFTFGGFVFSKAGTYAYAVNETQPGESEDTEGVTYDSNTATVYFYVTDNGSGQLQVSPQITGIDVDSQTSAGIFVNTYEYTPVTLTQNTDSGLGVQKTVTGAPNSEDFNFTATFNADDEKNTGSADNIDGLTDGALTVTISEDFEAGNTKSADFGTVTFNAPGVYVFDVTEDNTTTAAGWTYDDTTKQIVVTVTDNTEGEACR